jgi:hypothetical protein
MFQAYSCFSYNKANGEIVFYLLRLPNIFLGRLVTLDNVRHWFTANPQYSLTSSMPHPSKQRHDDRRP